MAGKKAVNPRMGSDFEDFLRVEGMLEDIDEAVSKRILAWQMEQALKARSMTRTELAAKMGTSRAVVNRLLNPRNPSVNYRTMHRAAEALGKRLSIQLVDE